MDHSFCPGARFLRQPKPEMFDCPVCGEEVEIWSDEIRGVCANCGRTLFREGNMSCLQWCKFARECVGDQLYDRYQKNRAGALRRRLLDALADDGAEGRQRSAVLEELLAWSERILCGERADWHIVIPAVILQNSLCARDSAQSKAVMDVLLRSGLLEQEIDSIRRIAARDPVENSREFDVVHDAAVLARGLAGAEGEEALRTETGKKLATASLVGAQVPAGKPLRENGGI